MRKNGKKIRLLGVATLLASQLGVFSSALTVVADETTASTSESALVTNTSSEESSTNHSTSATTTTTDATTRASSDKEETSSSSSDDTEEKTVKIGDIQGEAQRSPLEGQKVAIKNAVGPRQTAMVFMPKILNRMAIVGLQMGFMLFPNTR